LEADSVFRGQFSSRSSTHSRVDYEENSKDERPCAYDLGILDDETADCQTGGEQRACQDQNNRSSV
jgi:hypothetical protein